MKLSKNLKIFWDKLLALKELILFWFDNSRWFALPMTILSWFVAFLYSMKCGGSIFNGLLALVGISFAHLATNLFDDYLDYKYLSKSPERISSAVSTKCAYIRSGKATCKQLLIAVGVCCVLAALVGLILFLQCGVEVLWLAFVGACVVLSYSSLSRVGLSELTVMIAFGPLLFEGVYFVMTGSFSFSLLLLSVAVVSMTVNFLYIHTLLDYDCDLISHKKTMCCRIGESLGKQFLFVPFMIYSVISFVLTICCSYLEKNPFYLVVFLTVPFVGFIYSNTQKYLTDKNSEFKVRWWNYPLDNWSEISQTVDSNFYFNLFQVRNLAMWFQLLVCIALILG